jgi:hypothetical protein
MVASSHKTERKKLRERILSLWVLLVSKDHSCTASDRMAEEEEGQEEGIAAAAAR